MEGSILVSYFKALSVDPDSTFPSAVSEMVASSLDFEVNRLCEYVVVSTSCKTPYLMDNLDESEIIPLFTNENDDVRVSAILSIINMRIPALNLYNYV
jgi:hypothetical protein